MASETILVIDDSPTIVKVVELVLAKAGYQVVTATDGEAGVAAARAQRPDLILLDFVMPRMNGYQVCRALAQEEGLRDVPVVLMSAKGDQVGERFVKSMGIVDYITKPFSPEAIMAVVAHAVGKYQGSTAEAATPLLAGSGDSSPTAAAEAAAEARRSALAELRAALVRAVAEHCAAQSLLGSTLDPGAVAETAAAALADSVLDGILGQLRTRATAVLGSDEEIVLGGDLRVVPIAEVLQLLAEQTQDGTLTVSRERCKVELHFCQGKIDLGTAAGLSDEFLLGRFVVENQLLSRQDLDLFLRSRTGAPRLLGHQLVKLGYLSDTDLKQALAQQTAELVYEILRWSSGRFSFRALPEAPAIAVEASLGLSVEGILMEGFRRVDEWHLIEREIDSFDTVFLRDEEAVTEIGRGRLTREELQVLELVNGKNTIKEIVRQSRMGSFEVSKMLYRLLCIKLIRRRVLPVAV